MNDDTMDDILREAQQITETFAGHGWGTGAAGAYRDQGEIDALIAYGPRMLNALRMLVMEVRTLRDKRAETDAAMRAQFEDVATAVIRARAEMLAPPGQNTPAPLSRAKSAG